MRSGCLTVDAGSLLLFCDRLCCVLIYVYTEYSVALVELGAMVLCCRLAHVTPGHSNRVFSLKFDPDNDNTLISGGWDNTVQVRCAAVLSCVPRRCCVCVIVWTCALVARFGIFALATLCGRSSGPTSQATLSTSPTVSFSRAPGAWITRWRLVWACHRLPVPVPVSVSPSVS